MAYTELLSAFGGYGPTIIIVLAATILFLWRTPSVARDSGEPPVIRPKIPLVGHLVGMLSHKSKYFDKLR
jgi:hypothetical protein